LQTLNYKKYYLGSICDNNKFLLFWDGIFSQWSLSEFNIDKIKFNCAEQYMMYNKAILFNDIKTANEILKSHLPRHQKRLGRKVKNFKLEKWNSNCKEIVYKGNYAKFTQNKDLFECMKLTNNLTLVEASPNDKIWGIGLHEDDINSCIQSNWLGKNWLGFTLTKLRDDLIKIKEN